MTELSADVLMRLGPSPMELTRLGASRIFRGDDLMAKFGPEERIAREAFLFGETSALMPIGIPTFEDAGPGWILTQDPRGEPASPNDVLPLAKLATMHELFQGAAGIEHERFRDVFGRERDELLAKARASSIADALPQPLGSLLTDPSPLLSVVADEPRTLVHGDAGPGNVVARGPGDFVWLNWEDAGSGPAAFDLAIWLYGSPRAPGSMSPEGALGAYLEARTTRIDPRGFKRAVDAAAVLGFLLLDVVNLSDGEPDLHRGIVERRNELAESLLG